jgi:Rad3-related DNA helicase
LNIKPIKTLTTLEKKPSTISINMVIVSTKNKKNEEQLFKEMEPLNNKMTTNWTKEKKCEKDICGNSLTTINSYNERG